jgi:glycosyltransferase involved in cell wall biosynthesis
MRILVISDLPQFVTGGAEKQAANLIEAWLDAGHEVACFGRRMGSGPVLVGRHEVPVRRIRTLQRLGRLLRGISYLLSLATLLLRYRRRFDVIYTRFLGEAALTASLLKQLHMIDMVLVSTPANTGETGSDAQFLAGLPCKRRLVRLLDKRCNAINLIAPAMMDELCGLGFSGRNFAHIPNGVSIHATPPPGSLRPHRFLAVGRIARQKGYDTLIEAMRLIRDQLQPGLVRIAGDGPERASLQARAKALDVNHAIEWLGELSHDAVLHELEQAQVLLLPSRYEGMSNAGLEAMERGLAMLMTRCGGLDAYIQPDMGWVVEPEDTKALAAAMSLALAATAPTLAAMGERNRAYVLQHFDLPMIATRYLALFESASKARHSENLT